MDNYFIIELVSDDLFTITLTSDDIFEITLDQQMSEHAYYEGEVQITPEVEAQVLETANKIIRTDITVMAIPYYETSNIDGTTVYIASEL